MTISGVSFASDVSDPSLFLTPFSVPAPFLLAVNVLDDDAPGFVFTPLSGDSYTVAEGATFTYYVHLKTPPFYPVTLSLAFDWSPVSYGTSSVVGGHPGFELLSGDLTFDSSNWDVPQAVTFSTTFDGRLQSYPVVFNHVVTTSDEFYQNLASSQSAVSVVIVNTEVPELYTTLSRSEYILESTFCVGNLYPRSSGLFIAGICILT
jgi:hypothetical protein